MKYVVYSGDDEVIVCTKKSEKQTLKEWFEDGGRDLECYNRIESKGPVLHIYTDIRVSGDY